jgi:hypothetical protein
VRPSARPRRRRRLRARAGLRWPGVGMAADRRAGAARPPRDGRPPVRRVRPGVHAAGTVAELRRGRVRARMRLPVGAAGRLLSADGRARRAARGAGRAAARAPRGALHHPRCGAAAAARDRVERRAGVARTQARPLRRGRGPHGARRPRPPARLRRRRRGAARDLRRAAGDALPEPGDRGRRDAAVGHAGAVHAAHLVGDQLPPGAAADTLRGRRRRRRALRRGARVRLALRRVLRRRGAGGAGGGPGHRAHRPGAHAGAGARRRGRARAWAGGDRRDARACRLRGPRGPRAADRGDDPPSVAAVRLGALDAVRAGRVAASKVDDAQAGRPRARCARQRVRRVSDGRRRLP